MLVSMLISYWVVGSVIGIALILNTDFDKLIQTGKKKI
jgi:hypothetical protein